MHEGKTETKLKFDELSNKVLGCAIEVHRELGPGLLESTYEQCLAYELSRTKIPSKVQVELPVEYKEIRLDCDGDAVLMKVDQVGGIACHTGRPSCFFRTLENRQWVMPGQEGQAILDDPARFRK